MGCAYCGRKRRRDLAVASNAQVPVLVLGEQGLVQVRFLGEGRGRIVGAETEHWYEFAPGQDHYWVDQRDLAGFLELRWNEAPLFEAL